MHRDGVDRIRRRADGEQCSEPAGSAGGQRGYIHYAGSTGSRAPADYVSAASDTGASCDTFPDSVRGGASFERDATANCGPEHPQRCQQRTGYGERESGASYTDQRRGAGVTRRGYDE